MREIYQSGATPQQKLVGVNKKFGNTGIKDQQGTTRIIYDALPTGTATTFRFFEDSSSRRFPFTNTGSDGNKLGVGDTMVVAQVMFYLVDINNTSGQANFGGVNQFPLSGTTQSLGLFSFEIANNRVIKNVPLTEGLAAFDKTTTPTGQSNIELETQIVIPPLLNYVLELRIPSAIAAAAAGSTRYLYAAIIGTGGIIAPRTTF
jgi:hypothetical protein